MHRSTYAIFFFLVAFGVFKVLRFQTLGYTFNDMYGFIQMSCSYLDGRPFMYENVWGYHHRIHNYYTVLLWGPLCYSLGAYGLFLVQVGWLIVSYFFIHEQLLRDKVPSWVRWLLFGVVLLGPVTFWLNDHPNIGWHTELTYFPFALLFALALGRGNLLTTILSGIGLALVKEDGAVLALLIHISAETIRFLHRHPGKSPIQVLATRRVWWIILGWSSLFLLGMWWVGFKNDFAEPRLKLALQLIGQHIGEVAFWKQMLTLCLYSFLLLTPIIGTLGLLAAQLSRPIGLALVVLYSVGILILTILNFVQSSHYYGQPLFFLVSLTWPPRFVLVWGFSCAFLLLVLICFRDQFKPLPGPVLVGITTILFLIQIPVLYLTRPDFISFSELKATLLHRTGVGKNPVYLPAEDLFKVHCIAEQIPARSSIFAFDYVVPYFHNHYELWLTGNHWEPADIAILPSDNFQGFDAKLKVMMKTPYQAIRLKAYTIYVTPDYLPYVERCVRQ